MRVESELETAIYSHMLEDLLKRILINWIQLEIIEFTDKPN